MTIGYQYILLVIAGLAGVVYGLPAAHRLKCPFDIAAALAVLAGVVATAMGILLTFIPGFFR
ncbi:MAG TPA: hypothetical protein HPP94_06575 [Desulfuromonadales bacterium]|nr:hypothetical protein [Desulfuromonadales bacterium]